MSGINSVAGPILVANNNRETYRGNYRGRSLSSRGNSYRGSYINSNDNLDTNTKQQANTAEEHIALYAAHLSSKVEDKVSFILHSRARNHFVQENLEQHMYNVKIL